MKLRSGRFALALALVVAAAVGFYMLRRSHGNRSQAVRAGTFAPDFTLPQVDGGLLQLSSYRGKVVLLDFWATWCEPCREEIPNFVKLQNQYGARGLQIIGVSMDDGPDPVREFYRQFHMNYPVVMGTPAAAEAYGGVLGLPIAFLIDRQGRIHAKHLGATDPAVFETEVTTLLQN